MRTTSRVDQPLYIYKDQHLHVTTKPTRINTVHTKNSKYIRQSIAYKPKVPNTNWKRGSA